MAFDGRLLAGVSVLAAVVETGNFARAADALGLTPSGVSRSVTRLEARVGVRLLQRTTRSIKLTDEGALFYAQVGPLLTGIEDAATSVSAGSHAVRGRLRVNADPLFCGMVLAPRLPDFFNRYPELELELIARDQIGDLIGDGMDVAVRFGFPPSSSLIARQLLHTRILTVASPRYIERHGRPETPADLTQHRCLHFRDPQTKRPYEWELHRGRKVLAIDARGPLLVNDTSTMMSACLAGVGIAQVLALGVQNLLASGQLIELFPDWTDELFPLYAFYPSRQHAPAKVRAFVDFCLESLG
jgi:DNA-binding transcriptional LysR family regulator